MNDMRTRRRFDAEKLIWLLLALVFAERIGFLIWAGPGAVYAADDVGYVESARYFAQTGVIAVWGTSPTALIMPGTTLIAGSFVRLFGEGKTWLLATNLVWISLGTLTGLFIYRAARLFTTIPWALLAASALLLPNKVWLDTVISTETPYLCFFCMNLYYLLRLQRDKSLRCAFLYALSFVLALLFRAAVVIMPLFGLLWLGLCKTYTRREIARRVLLFLCVSLLFFVPWTIRNYLRFNAFIPLSDGAGDPTYKGTYQGSSSPSDEGLDYETNVYAVIRERYSEYYDEDGSPKSPAYGAYLSAKARSLSAQYRMRVWFRSDPGGFLRAYLIEKPLMNLFCVYFWGPGAAELIPYLNILSKLNFLCCALGCVLAFVRKKQREIMVFLSLIYWVNIYMIAMSYSLERYAALLLPMRYIVGAIGLSLIWETVRSLRAGKGLRHGIS